MIKLNLEGKERLKRGMRMWQVAQSARDTEISNNMRTCKLGKS
jgi:hypothetical protein